jgi:hypothetical protein
MSPENESAEPENPVGTTDPELFDSALDVGLADDGAIDNPNSDT